MDDLGFAMLVGGWSLSFLMLLDESLFNTTRKRSLRLVVGYTIVLAFLYGSGVCASIFGLSACSTVSEMWLNLGHRYVSDTVDFLGVLSGFAGFTISTSGTSSHKWQNIGYALFALFVVALLLSIYP